MLRPDVPQRRRSCCHRHRYEEDHRPLSNATPIAGREERTYRSPADLGVVHQVTRPSDQTLQDRDDRIADIAAAGDGEVSRGGSVQRAQAANPVGSEPLRTASSLSDQRLKLAPIVTAFGDESV